MARVFLESIAQREFKKLPKDARLLVWGVLIGTFSKDPLSRALDVRKLQPPLFGYRLRIGAYRVLFAIESEDVRIYSIRHRRDAYR